MEQDDAVVIFDDTIQEKQWIDENEIMCCHFDHVVGQPIKTMAGCVTSMTYSKTSTDPNI